MLWTILGSAVACDGSTGLDDPHEARFPNTCVDSAVALMATCYSAISGIAQPVLSPVSWMFFNRVTLVLCCRIRLRAFLPLCQAVLAFKGLKMGQLTVVIRSI